MPPYYKARTRNMQNPELVPGTLAWERARANGQSTEAEPEETEAEETEEAPGANWVQEVLSNPDKPIEYSDPVVENMKKVTEEGVKDTSAVDASGKTIQGETATLSQGEAEKPEDNSYTLTPEDLKVIRSGVMDKTARERLKFMYENGQIANWDDLSEEDKLYIMSNAEHNAVPVNELNNFNKNGPYSGNRNYSGSGAASGGSGSSITPAQEYKAQSILEAWRDGKIGKSTRDYLIANTLATAAGNIGRLFNNVGAAYSGGTIDNNQDQSLWAQEQAKQLNPEAMDSRKMNRARIAAQNINNMNASDRRSVAAKIKKELDKVDPTSMEGERLYNIYNKIMSGGQMSILDMLGSGIIDLFD